MHTRTHTRAAAVKKRASLWRGILSVLRKMYSNSTPCDWKVYSETCLQSPPASPASQPPSLPAPPSSRCRRRGDRAGIPNPEGPGWGAWGMGRGKGTGVQGRCGGCRVETRSRGPRAPELQVDVCDCVCRARSLPSLSSQRLHIPSPRLLLLSLRGVVPVNSPDPAGGFIVLSEGLGLTRAHPPPSLASKRLFIPVSS
jgi:hypothetical protein